MNREAVLNKIAELDRIDENWHKWEDTHPFIIELQKLSGGYLQAKPRKGNKLSKEQVAYVLTAGENKAAKVLAEELGVTANCINKLKRKHDVKKAYKKRGRVKQIDRSGKVIKTFESIAEASVKTGVSNQSIYRVATKSQLTGGGFVWEFEEDL